MLIRRLPRLTRLAATLLALAVVTGVALPRPRLPGRERTARLTAAGSTRSDQPCAWVFPHDPDPDVTAASDTVAVGDDLGAASRAWLPPATAAGTPPAAVAVLIASLPPAVALDRLGIGRPAGRAPPPSRS
jgi:hypothetical protein